MKAPPRRQLFVDHKVQGALMLRAAMYWALCLFTVTLLLICWRMLTGPARPFYTHFDDLWFHFAPAMIVALLLLPVIVADSVRLTNRFAGPMYRLRRMMRQLAAGEPTPEIHFRKGDFWQDFADDFNTLRAKFEEMREKLEAAESQARLLRELSDDSHTDQFEHADWSN